MALKKSELYSSLWQGCDELRGGMDASQYKDYVLVLLFIKYISDKYAGVPYAPIEIPEGASFRDMVALKGKSDIGDQINKKIIAPLVKANKLAEMPDFNDANKLGSGQELRDRLTNLIAIFENKALDFSKNRADGDDILGDAYEYLMRHFATESGKSKGQFYTPAEVSRVIAKVIGIHEGGATTSTTVYDPTCGSGLPPNLFYGTGIPACVIVLDKEDAHARKGIFMIDASGGFLKDGNKNRLRAMDIHKIVDAFNKRLELPKYSRMVSVDEIEKNEFNLNIPRYIDSQQEEDIQDIEGHLRGGIPVADIDALDRYWIACPKLRASLFKPNRPGYVDLAVEKAAIKSTIYDHLEFTAFIDGMNAHFAKWRKRTAATLKGLEAGCHPKKIIVALSEGLLAHYTGKPLIDKYNVYQHLMDYWGETMQDDCYLIAVDGWKAETAFEKDKKGRDRGWTCDLVPKTLIVARYFRTEQKSITTMEAELERGAAQMMDVEEEHGGEEGTFSALDKVNKASVIDRLKEIKGDKDAEEEAALLNEWLDLNNREADIKRTLKQAEINLDMKAHDKYPTLNEIEIQTLVVDDKWLSALAAAIHGELDRISLFTFAQYRDIRTTIQPGARRR